MYTLSIFLNYISADVTTVLDAYARIRLNVQRKIAKINQR